MPFCHARLSGPRPLPRSYPQVLVTIGDHLRKRRLDLGLLQREVADRLGVSKSTVTNWELNRSTPALRFLPRIIALLGLDPRPAGTTLGDQLVACRTVRGLSQEAAAQMLGVIQHSGDGRVVEECPGAPYWCEFGRSLVRHEKRGLGQAERTAP